MTQGMPILLKWLTRKACVIALIDTDVAVELPSVRLA